MPNAIAYLALFAWPLVGALLFHKLPTHKAIIWTILGGYLVLPERVGIDLPLLPAFDKTFIPAATALFFCLPRLGSLWELLPQDRVASVLALTFMLSPFGTAFTNGDPQIFGPTYLPGLRPYDAFSFGLSHAVHLVPFLLAQRFIRNEAALRDLLASIAIAGLIYSLPALFEVRMSPQLHTWIYGFFPHSFIQQVRFGGFRPVVFLGHGLLVGLLISMSTLASLALARGHQGPARALWIAASIWLAITLLLSKTVSAWVYAVALFPVLLLFGNRLKRMALLFVGSIVLLYPALRGMDLIPTARIEALAALINEARFQSLQYRFQNEDILLQRANERPFFGWGGWGRNEVHDNITGDVISVTDGAWIAFAGPYGWIGYIAGFGLLVRPLIMIGLGRKASFTTLALAVVLMANLIDLIPNSGLRPITWLVSGSIIGFICLEYRDKALRKPAYAKIRA
ncbi:MAG: O-antigen ligase family protein [Pseudomonadota bacterium]